MRWLRRMSVEEAACQDEPSVERKIFINDVQITDLSVMKRYSHLTYFLF